MNERGPCSSCGSPLAIDQRYCVECGQRVGPPLAMPYVPAQGEAAAVSAGSGGILSSLPMPLQTAATLAALALGFGVVAGTAITPNLAATVAGTVVVQQAPPPAASAAPVDAGGGGGGGGGGTEVVEEVIAEETFFEETVEEVPEREEGPTKEPKPEPVFANGVVVHANPVAQSYAVASGVSVIVVHTAKALPAIGTQLKVPVAELANRTSVEDGKRRLNGQVAAATFSGIVTYNSDSGDPQIRDTYTVSALGASILVHSPQDTTPGTIAGPPAVGSFVKVLVAIADTIPDPPLDAELDPDPAPAPDPPPPSPSCAAPAKPLPDPPLVFAKSLYETGLTIEANAADVDSSEVAGVIQAGCAPAGRLLLSADDVRESKADLFDPVTGAVLQAAPGVDLSGFAPGQAVIANVTLAEDGDPATPPGTKIPAQITGIRGDTGVAGADQAGGEGDLR